VNKLHILTNQIIISDDFEDAKEQVLQSIEGETVKIFCKDEFLTEDAREITKEAYIKEEGKKYILICAKAFNIYAQNSLLKILEESPKDTVFIIISNSKSNFLPTIRSRLQIVNISTKKEREPIDIDLRKMGLNDIFSFIKQHQKMTKSELKELIQNILYEAIHTYHIILNEDELRVFENALKLAELNSRSDFLLSSVLLAIFERDKKQDRY